MRTRILARARLLAMQLRTPWRRAVGVRSMDAPTEAEPLSPLAAAVPTAEVPSTTERETALVRSVMERYHPSPAGPQLPCFAMMEGGQKPCLRRENYRKYS